MRKVQIFVKKIKFCDRMLIMSNRGDGMNSVTLLFVTFFLISVGAIITVLNIIQIRKNHKMKKVLEKLEIEKNTIDSTPITPELEKIGKFMKAGKLEILYEDWKSRLDSIKSIQIPKITDLMLEADYSLSQMDYKSTLYKIAKLEMELYKVRTNSERLLQEIRDLTNSEEKNRGIVTKLKASYRNLYQKYQETSNEYGRIGEYVRLQFENIAKRFEAFEVAMDENNYGEIATLIKAIDEMLKHMEVVVEEVPAIILLTDTILPKKMKEVETVYDQMMREGYPLDYLNIEYNISEAEKKIDDILDRAKVLNLEDSLFELKVLLDYFDSVFNDFEKEKIERHKYEESNRTFKVKLEHMNELVLEIFSGMDHVKKIYNLSKEDIAELNRIHDELDLLNEDYVVLIEHTRNHTFAYSKIIVEIESLVSRLSNLEERLDTTLDTIGSMHDDEVRARQQLEEVKHILKEARNKIREYHLPVIPKSYFVELSEAQAAIKEIVKELDKKPITIEVLNTRVDTARDLVFKLFTRTKMMMRNAMFAEMAIIYGNRYRTSVEDLDKQLNHAEVLFYKGEYQRSLELTINSLNKIEPGIYDKLLGLYGTEQ